MNDEIMQLKIMVPEHIMEDRPVDKIIAEAPNGFFCLKPRHVDFTSALKPGILYYYRGTREHIIAIDRGILVKCGREVLVSVLNAIKGDNLSALEQQVRQEFQRIAKTEQAASTALRNLEADLIQHFIGLDKELDMNY
ncbi:F0F1 ATP synthase subunit epsilon [Fodinibius sediminis]|uniref:F-type H+-transporting ATPase subunit epsilon n=1 Tax=Fodinibius sediminis TaxID=1214077 RepID=A0A521CUQ6_9BACT|nr:F0F1 ATP synthase subunit epsilon [Fodinibius sediminis]SMO63189.1 F-type H+-transporting ATPase subunit epsilon [Fodinibius sediminis]